MICYYFKADRHSFDFDFDFFLIWFFLFNFPFQFKIIGFPLIYLFLFQIKYQFFNLFFFYHSTFNFLGFRIHGLSRWVVSGLVTKVMSLKN